VLDGTWVDPTRLVLLLAGTGASGYAVEEELLRRRMPLEMADRDTVVAMLTLADDEPGIDALVEALVAAVRSCACAPRAVRPSPAWSVEPEQVVSPREAFFAPHVTVPVADAVGRVCAELVAPYPPGVPVLAPGERVTAEVVESLRVARDDGARIAYAADPTLATLQVL
jgi:lysine decarboxylase